MPRIDAARALCIGGTIVCGLPLPRGDGDGAVDAVQRGDP